jgi:hypothetical protein
MLIIWSGNKNRPVDPRKLASQTPIAKCSLFEGDLTTKKSFSLALEGCQEHLYLNSEFQPPKRLAGYHNYIFMYIQVIQKPIGIIFSFQ